MKSVKIGLCGLGTVGSSTFNVMVRNSDEISSRAGCQITVAQVGARRDHPACDLRDVAVSRDIFEVVDNADIDIIVELIGGTTVAKEVVERAIANGKHVVTANKALIAEFGNDIFAAAQKQGVTIAYEAAVAGGIPIIKALREGLAANRIEWLAGIINGTGNFILTEMADKGRDFVDVLKEAQALGYAEADPTFDIEGIDAAHKLVILASLAFAMPLQYNKVFTEGISCIETKDIDYAKKLGYHIKHLGIARRVGESIELRVHPTLIPEKRLIANVNGVMNAIVIKGDAVGPTLYCGAGAGAEPTASAVIADIVDIARQISRDSQPSIPSLGFNEVSDKPLRSIADVQTAYYLRVLVEDKPGVLSQITTILSEAGISVEAMQQSEPEEGEVLAEVVVVTNRVQQQHLLGAVNRIETLASIHGNVHKIRVESLG
ncbi:homoserine dehydrogenase [Candidatus Endobugula sertula]|uniref:Homoserine dehydrogenase n=1 Tax=Candidatus Endobugula sertula TaxID=62101 RepID=A0A1D2QU33_9GAMM|nr:homoserine dehydrogenase [Candidatus Endobugula sertula]